MREVLASAKRSEWATTKRASCAPSLPDDYLITPPYPKQPLLTVGGNLQRQSLLNVSGDGGCSIPPEHGLSPIRLRRPLGDDHVGSRRSPQQLRPLARLRLQAQRFHHLLRDMGRSTPVQNRLA
jgi:hypothetical protein